MAGVALSVESWVNVPVQYRHLHPGTFILTTVISHAPILAREWFVARFDPAMAILPPEAVVPQTTTPQERAKQDYQMLDDGEAAAVPAGLRLAGCQTQMEAAIPLLAATFFLLAFSSKRLKSSPYLRR